MRKLTFDSIMSFYEKHNRSVYRRIVEAQRNGTLSPFVGAGLSVPFGYQQWGGVLKELAKNILDGDKKALVLGQIKDSQYEEAAGTILAEYPFMLDQLPDIVSPDILAKCPDEKKRSSAAWVLPYLFRRELVMTTNFDRCLEECYLSHQNTAIPTVTPVNRDRLAQLQLNQELCLLKLHGDIGKEAVSIDDLVFTEEQYKAHYAEGSPLVSVLTQRFTNRRMLFLGCSLSSDRTMTVLEQVVKDQKGIRHFAILGCKKSEISAKMKELQTLGILPIFYDDSNHDAVRVILERLLEETDSAGYKRLCRSCRSVVPAAEEKRPLMFDSEYFPFSGREEELARLTEFCEAEDPLLWWSVTGPGGMGKSRLVFEFCKDMRKQGWKIQRFEANPSRGGEARRLEELPGWTPDVDRTIVVLDDVQAYMESVCAWMTRMDSTPRSEDLRILLLEREGTTIQDSSWMGPDFKNSHLDEWCHSESFLRLESMTDEQLMAVMTNYAKVAGKTLNAELLLKTLERIDPEFKRPLYAVAIADTRCQGKDPTNWDRDKILDTLLDRELKFHLDRLQGICDRRVKISKTLQSQMELLLANSCLNILLPLDQVDWSQYDVLQKRMREAEMEPEEFCQRLGILRTAQLHGQEVDLDGNPVSDSILETELKVIALTCPDLLKEHLVLKLAFEGNKLDLLPEGWHLDLNRLMFLHKLWANYPDRLKEQTAFWDRFFSAPTTSGLPAWLYANLLWGCTVVFPSLARQAMETLAGLYGVNDDDEEIAKCYAIGLFNLSADQSPAEQAVTAERLETLYKTHPARKEIAVAYAKSLLALFLNQKQKDTSAIVDQLKDLYDAHSDNADIAVAYALALSRLSVDQSPAKRIAIAAQLKTLYKTHTTRKEIAVAYAKGLLLLLLNQTQKDTSAIVDRLRNLYDAHSDNADITAAYALALSNPSADQSPEERVTTVERLETLYKAHPTREEIAVAYARGLLALFLNQKQKDTSAIVDQLRDLYDTHSDNADIAVAYALALFSLSADQSPEEQAATAERLETLYKTHPAQKDVAVAYAKSLLASLLNQTQKDTSAIVDRLRNLYDAHSDNADIAVAYALSLVILSAGQAPGDRAATVERLKELYDAHSENTEVAVPYVVSLFNLNLDQAESDIPATVSDIADFLRAHPAAIPGFREALDIYLSEHPDHKARYQPLLELGGDGNA